MVDPLSDVIRLLRPRTVFTKDSRGRMLGLALAASFSSRRAGARNEAP